MGRVYTAIFSAVAVSAVQDFFEVLAATGKPFKLLRITLGQTGTDIGDANDEVLRVQIKRWIGGTSGSGGSTATLNKHATNDAAAGPTPEINNTTQAVAGGGSLTTILEETFNIRVGYEYLPTPEQVMIFLAAEAAIVSLPAAPTDSVTMSGSITIEEL